MDSKESIYISALGQKGLLRKNSYVTPITYIAQKILLVALVFPIISLSTPSLTEDNYPILKNFSALSDEVVVSRFNRILSDDPYIPLGVLMPYLKSMLNSENIEVRGLAPIRLANHYKYPEESPDLFIGDKGVELSLINMLDDKEYSVYLISFSVLAEEFDLKDQELFLRLKKAYELEDDVIGRQTMTASLATSLRSEPGIIKPLLIREVLVGAGLPTYKASAPIAAKALSMSDDKPVEILEPVIQMLTTSHYLDPTLLSVLNDFGGEVKRYEDVIKKIYKDVDEAKEPIRHREVIMSKLQKIISNFHKEVGDN